MAYVALYVKETIGELDGLSKLFIILVPQKLEKVKTRMQSKNLLTFEPIGDGYKQQSTQKARGNNAKDQ
ncbi:MAG: hypothetical protein ACI965_002426 [Paraglaciecola sp.]